MQAHAACPPPDTIIHYLSQTTCSVTAYLPIITSGGRYWPKWIQSDTDQYQPISRVSIQFRYDI